jgi:hypothetical protein
MFNYSMEGEIRGGPRDLNHQFKQADNFSTQGLKTTSTEWSVYKICFPVTKRPSKWI